MNICVIGLGYVGLTSATVFASWGNFVSCVNHDLSKISKLQNGIVPIYEPGLELLIHENVKAGRLNFLNSLPEALENAEIIFLAIQTPMSPNGKPDLSFLTKAASEVASTIHKETVIVTKSTSPPGTYRKLQQLLRKECSYPCPLVVNPEFLREGSALHDMKNPDRVIIGSDDPVARSQVATVYKHLNTVILETDPESAEIIKYAANSFLASKISYANALARLCDVAGADIELVTTGIGLDQRIGPNFLKAGLGYGGSCFPKDLAGFINWSSIVGYDFKLLKAVDEINQTQIDYIFQAIKKLVGEPLHGKTLTLLGLAFKPNTDDIRESPALKLAFLLNEEGCILNGYDPKAMEHTSVLAPYIKLKPDIETACNGSNGVLILTEWPEFSQLNLEQIGLVVKQKILIDARNLLIPEKVRESGWQYWSVGRR